MTTTGPSTPQQPDEPTPTEQEVEQEVEAAAEQEIAAEIARDLASPEPEQDRTERIATAQDPQTAVIPQEPATAVLPRTEDEHRTDDGHRAEDEPAVARSDDAPRPSGAEVPVDPYPAPATPPTAQQPVAPQPTAASWSAGPTGPAAPTWTAAPPPPVQPAQPAPEPAPVSREPRTGTVVWGLVVAVCGIGILAMAAGARIDVQLAFIILLAGAGAALLLGSVISAARRRGHGSAGRQGR
jgi:hypothetical protein